MNLAIAAFLLGSTNMCVDFRMFRMVRKETVYEQRNTGIKNEKKTSSGERMDDSRVLLSGRVALKK